MRRTTNARLRLEAKRLADAQAIRRRNRLKRQFPRLTDRELAAIETDYQLSYLAGFTRGIHDRSDH